MYSTYSPEAPRTAPEQRFHQREFLELPQHADTGTSLLNAHRAPSQASAEPSATPAWKLTPVQQILPRTVQPACKWFVSDVKKRRPAPPPDTNRLAIHLNQSPPRLADQPRCHANQEDGWSVFRAASVEWTSPS